MESKRKTTRAYTISDESYNYLKQLGDEKGKSASFVLDELIKMIKKLKQERDNA